MSKVLFASVVIPVAIVISPIAAAFDWATFNGSLCQPYSRGDAARMRVTSAGVLNLSSDTTLRVICPVMRDAYQPAGTVKTMSLYVAMHNAVDGKAFRCEFYARTTFGRNPSAGSYQSSTYYGPGDHEMFYSVASNIAIEETDTFALDCKVPPKSKLYGIRTEEF